MDTQVLIFAVNMIIIFLGLIGFKYPFIALLGLVMGLIILLPNLYMLSGIMLSLTIISIFISGVIFILSMVKGD